MNLLMFMMNVLINFYSYEWITHWWTLSLMNMFISVISWWIPQNSPHKPTKQLFIFMMNSISSILREPTDFIMKMILLTFSYPRRLSSRTRWPSGSSRGQRSGWRSWTRGRGSPFPSTWWRWSSGSLSPWSTTSVGPPRSRRKPHEE